MSCILTITFSPCIDKSTSIPSLIPEKKLRCNVPKLEPGGGGINVARAITKLGGKATAIFPSGGYTGQAFNHLLSQEQIPSISIQTRNETRENFIVLDETANSQYRFGMPGTFLDESEWKQCLEAVSSKSDVEYVVASGSLPPGVPVDIYAMLAQIARKKNIKLIVDTSGEPLKRAADEGLFMLKPNLGELASIVGKTDLSHKEIKDIATGIISKGRIQALTVTMGAAGCMLVSNSITKTFTPPKVERKSTVGAGDSMVAGTVFYLSSGRGLSDAVRFGVACGTAATMNPGTELCRKEDAEKLFDLIEEVGMD